MEVTHRIRQANASDAPAIADLLRDASTWLASKGTDQWQYPPRMDRIAAAIERGSLFLVEEQPGRLPVATITMTPDADPDFWAEQDEPQSALYVGRMSVLRSRSGRQLGGRMLDWVSRRAAKEEKKWVRLDAWRTNEELHEYYLGQGFKHIRTVDRSWRQSGALFQRPAGLVLYPSMPLVDECTDSQ
ncbi:GNAT family N-acetyltransferase [Spirillospora sp. NPDC048911]|uniref:GNAT family N-acetyltransferase n=1 Tax=Spirillospora sp. NPDC048911 TaxID=3364527 RepID=UPI00371A980D